MDIRGELLRSTDCVQDDAERGLEVLFHPSWDAGDSKEWGGFCGAGVAAHGAGGCAPGFDDWRWRSGWGGWKLLSDLFSRLLLGFGDAVWLTSMLAVFAFMWRNLMDAHHFDSLLHDWRIGFLILPRSAVVERIVFLGEFIKSRASSHRHGSCSEGFALGHDLRERLGFLGPCWHDFCVSCG